MFFGRKMQETALLYACHHGKPLPGEVEREWMMNGKPIPASPVGSVHVKALIAQTSRKMDD